MPQCTCIYSSTRSEVGPVTCVVRLARSRADKDLDPDDGDEGGSVSWTDNTGMLSTTYCSLLVSLWDQLSITQIGKPAHRGLAHAKVTQHVSADSHT